MEKLATLIPNQEQGIPVAFEQLVAIINSWKAKGKEIAWTDAVNTMTKGDINYRKPERQQELAGRLAAAGISLLGMPAAKAPVKAPNQSQMALPKKPFLARWIGQNCRFAQQR